MFPVIVARVHCNLASKIALILICVFKKTKEHKIMGKSKLQNGVC